MARISILDPTCISKIAAGEVIERPASVVKELLENSIDASATEIRLSIVKGGKDLIEVKDDGVGIRKTDLPAALKRHSTSKITNEKDLENIQTMGFRGEALYSIASVSRLEIISKTDEDDVATLLSTNGDINNFTLKETVMSSSGTIVRIKDLFFNFNVRRKFLKSSVNEEAPIFNIISQYAVAFPNIAFTYVSDNKIKFQTFKNQPRIFTIKNIFGKQLADSLIDIGIFKQNNIEIQGFLSRSGHHRRNRKFQFFFVNNRRIESSLIQSALEEGYGSYLMKQEFPIAFLFLELEPKDFDVNIHPQKRELLFYRESEVRNAIKNATSYSLRTLNIVPSLKPAAETKKNQVPLPIKGKSKSSLSNLKPSSNFSPSQVYIPTELNIKEAEYNVIASQPPETTLNLFGSNLRYKGMLGKEFVLLEDIATHDLIFLDFHASHERVNLERFQEELDLKQVKSQTFIKPFEFHITPDQLNLIKTHFNYLNGLGFDIKFSKDEHRIQIYSIPSFLAKTDLQPFFTELFDTIPDTLMTNQINSILSIIACHSSYKAGEVISFHQIKELIQALAKTENPTICAHGRPTYFRITYSEMLKQIRRT